MWKKNIYTYEYLLNAIGSILQSEYIRDRNIIDSFECCPLASREGDSNWHIEVWRRAVLTVVQAQEPPTHQWMHPDGKPYLKKCFDIIKFLHDRDTVKKQEVQKFTTLRQITDYLENFTAEQVEKNVICRLKPIDRITPKGEKNIPIEEVWRQCVSSVMTHIDAKNMNEKGQECKIAKNLVSILRYVAMHWS